MPETTETQKPQDTPEIKGWAKDDKYTYKFTQVEFEHLAQAFAPFQYANAILNMKASVAREDGGIRPIFESDMKYVVTNPDGSQSISKEFWEQFRPKQEEPNKKTLFVNSMGDTN
tara:strand:- start:3046 stop:3390 length:345 start_codon:yes stop_codon:yes gene_type:complete